MIIPTSDFMSIIKMTEDNTVLIVAVLAVIASLASAGFSYYSLSQGPNVIGFATSSTGTANLTVESSIEINFTVNNIDWGSGKVATGFQNATLNTTGAGSVTNGNWTARPGLVLENIGNTNVTLTLSAGDTAATLLGGTNPLYQWIVFDNETGSCASNNLSAWSNVNSSALACTQLGFLNNQDAIDIDFFLRVPYDSFQGALSDTITATGS